MPVSVVGRLQEKTVRTQQNGKRWIRGVIALHSSCKPILYELGQSRLDFTIITGKVLPAETVILMGEYDTYTHPDGSPWNTLNVQKIITKNSPLLKSLDIPFSEAIRLVAAKDVTFLEDLGMVQLQVRAHICDLLGTKNQFADKLIELYGDDAYEELCENPWRMIHLIPYYTVAHADKVAEQLEIPLDSPLRFHEVFRYHLDASFASHRNTYTSENEFLALYWMHFSDTMTLEDYRALATTKGSPVWKTALGYHPTHFYYAERASFDLIQAAMHVELPKTDREQGIIDTVLEDSAVPLTSEQSHAVTQAFHTPLHVITGGPGTGKTTVLKAVLDKLMLLTGSEPTDARAPFLLAAPTAKAAFRMWEQTGIVAHTLHSAFGILPGYGCLNVEETAKRLAHIRFLVIDEASMLDTQLFGDVCDVLFAMDHVPFLLLVGDADQLPPVQHGQVFTDILTFLRAKAPDHVTELTELKRQEKDSHILELAAYLRHGTFPDSTWFDGKTDVYFAPATLQTLPSLLRDGVLKPKQSVIHTIQTLTPYRNGTAPDTIHNINTLVKPLYNPVALDKLAPSVTVGDPAKTFHEGDTIINRINLSETIVNGSIGTIIEIDTRSQDLFAWTVTIRFGDESSYEDRTYLYEELQNIELAYAITVHASQGSEYETVVICLARGQANAEFLTRNLLYVAATRAVKRVLFLGDIHIFQRMAATPQKPRLTALQYWLANIV